MEWADLEGHFIGIASGEVFSAPLLPSTAGTAVATPAVRPSVSNDHASATPNAALHDSVICHDHDQKLALAPIFGFGQNIHTRSGIRTPCCME